MLLIYLESAGPYIAYNFQFLTTCNESSTKICRPGELRKTLLVTPLKSAKHKLHIYMDVAPQIVIVLYNSTSLGVRAAVDKVLAAATFRHLLLRQPGLLLEILGINGPHQRQYLVCLS